MLMSLYWGLHCFLFLSGIEVFVSNRKHLLSMLLRLEYIVFNLFFLLYFSLNLMDYSSFVSMMFLTFSVFEGALGLSILVSMIRTHLNDYFQYFNILQC